MIIVFGLVGNMFAVWISGKRSKCYLMCISQKHPGNPLCVSQKYKESNSFPFLDANKQNNYVMFFLCFCGKQSTCFPNVFQANTDFTCFPSLFSWKTVTIPSSDSTYVAYNYLERVDCPQRGWWNIVEVGHRNVQKMRNQPLWEQISTLK